ncbi:hypothetical protein [Bifidobacterium longum]|uniref:hypothetical protein n=1 Tax=Bifidobacterium longum TaxID=216816 RepID=UPI00351D61C7
MELKWPHGLSAEAASILCGVIQEEMFDSTESMSLDAAARQIGLSKQSARTYVGEILDAGLVVQSGKRPLKIRTSESLKSILSTGVSED